MSGKVSLGIPDLASDTVKAAADAMRAEIERMGILNVVVEPGTGIVAATGTIDPKAAAQWQTVQRWFDERFEGDITLVNGVTVKTEKVPVSLSIEGVWRGDPSPPSDQRPEIPRGRHARRRVGDRTDRARESPAAA